MKTIQSMCRTVVVALLATFLAGPAFASAGTPVGKPVPAETAAPASQAAATTSDTARYAARDAAAKNLESFTGGYIYEGRHGIYIGSGVVVAALLIVLILVLI